MCESNSERPDDSLRTINKSVTPYLELHILEEFHNYHHHAIGTQLLAATLVPR